MNKQEVMAKVALTEKDIERYRALIATLGLRK